MTTADPDDQGKTARIDLPAPAAALSTPSDAAAATPAPGAALPHEVETDPFEPAPAAPSVIEQRDPEVARPVAPPQPEVVFVPLAVNVGDGFKFGCGFFLAFVLAMLVGFVLLAALFVLASVFGLNVPITR